jgi:hypothetical protein
MNNAFYLLVGVSLALHFSAFRMRKQSFDHAKIANDGVVQNGESIRALREGHMTILEEIAILRLVIERAGLSGYLTEAEGLARIIREAGQMERRTTDALDAWSGALDAWTAVRAGIPCPGCGKIMIDGEDGPCVDCGGLSPLAPPLFVDFRGMRPCTDGEGPEGG